MIKNILHDNKKYQSNKGSGLGVILYGMTLLLVLLFTAINIVNSKVIEDGYNSLRDAVQTASSGSVIHLLTTNRTTTQGATLAQSKVIEEAKYDVYLQLALGYLINRDDPAPKETNVKTGDINNFIKLDHQKVVNTTLALLEDAVIRHDVPINTTSKYKIMMFFIEPYQKNNEKYFDIIAYGNGDYDGTTITSQLARSAVNSSSYRDMKEIYVDVERAISDIVNYQAPSSSLYTIDYTNKSNNKAKYTTANGTYFWIDLNSQGISAEQLIREMETYPHYLIVVKDFALPTIFNGKDTSDEDGGIRGLFTSLSGNGKLSSPMCALNTGKVERQVEDAGWRQDR